MVFPVDLSIGSIALIPVIVALVELAKQVGLPADYAPWLTGVLSVAGYALVQLVAARPDLLEPVTIGLTGLIIFLAATGLYKVAQRTVALARPK